MRLVRVPILLWERASVHTAELLREFSLVAAGAETALHPVPRRLLDLVVDLQARYAGVDDEPEDQRLTALAAGERRLDVTYRVVPAAAQACEDLLARLDETDEHCREGQLITLAAPTDQVAFRHWYLGEFIAQIAGGDPTPWPGSLG